MHSLCGNTTGLAPEEAPEMAVSFRGEYFAPGTLDETGVTSDELGDVTVD